MKREDKCCNNCYHASVPQGLPPCSSCGQGRTKWQPGLEPLRSEVRRLRGWLRVLRRRSGLIGWTLSCSDVDDMFADALRGKSAPSPKVPR